MAFQAIHVLAVIIVPIQAIAFSRIGVDCVISGSDPVLKAAQANSRRIAGVALVGTFLANRPVAIIIVSLRAIAIAVCGCLAMVGCVCAARLAGI